MLNIPLTRRTLQGIGKSIVDAIILCTILHIMTVWPLTSCEAERSISGIRRLKTYLRCTMKEDRLNGLALLMEHRSIRISIKEIIDVFASTQQRRMKFASLLDDATENSD